MHPSGINIGRLEFRARLICQKLKQLATIITVPGYRAVSFNGLGWVQTLYHKVSYIIRFTGLRSNFFIRPYQNHSVPMGGSGAFANA